MQILRSFETSESVRPTTENHIQEISKLRRQHPCIFKLVRRAVVVLRFAMLRPQKGLTLLEDSNVLPSGLFIH